MAEGSALHLEFDSDHWDSTISFQPGAPVNLAGALELSFVGSVDVASQVGRALRLFYWTGVSPTGQFRIRSPYVWDDANLYTTGEVTLWPFPNYRLLQSLVLRFLS